MTDNHLQNALQNNALWCDTVCQTHGIPGEFSPQLWRNQHRTPRYYPNVITLTDTTPASLLEEEIHRMELPLGCGVKDSFHALDLTPYGFPFSFEAEWIVREPSCSNPDTRIEGVDWEQVQTPEELKLWEESWSGAEKSPDDKRIFLPSLLEQPGVVFFVAKESGAIVAGGIANRTGEVVGVSNIFVPTEDSKIYRGGFLTEASRTFSGCALVGYEADKSLRDSLELGFVSVGALRVWIRQ
ncbi:hypothetical protein LBMAG21_13940 [Armatimonadota bacterium]|nr:hypothetical protein LBMAG21_13940 [Armatimonadota bacterium]